MTSPATTEYYKNHRFPGEIISHGVWLSYRFTLSDRDVQDLLLERRLDVSHGALHTGGGSLGRMTRIGFGADGLSPGTNGISMRYFRPSMVHIIPCRAVDQEGNGLAILVQSWRNQQAAKQFFRTLLKGLQDVPRMLITEKLTSYGVAQREM